MSDNMNPCGILIIEDDQAIRESLTDYLEFEGYQVQSAIHGKEGLDKLQIRPLPALIILDLMMPIMDGLQFLEIVKKDPLHSTIPIYVFSANASMVDLSGARGVLRKPSDLDLLLKVVKSHCD